MGTAVGPFIGIVCCAAYTQCFILGNSQCFWKLCLELHGKLDVGFLSCVTGGVGWSVSICALTLQGWGWVGGVGCVPGTCRGSNRWKWFAREAGSFSCAVCIEIVDNGS